MEVVFGLVGLCSYSHPTSRPPFSLVLQRSDQKELLRQVVERVIVDDDGQVTLELRSPFAYLNALVDDIRRANISAAKTVKRERRAAKNAGDVSLGVSPDNV